jgi:hypothetical protein
MKKEETKKFEELSLKVLGHKHFYRKLMSKGIVYDRKCVNPNSGNHPAFVARRQPLTAAGVWEYMTQTLAAQENKNAKG